VSRRIEKCFRAASAADRTVLIPFITAGDPNPDWTLAVMHTLTKAGADLIELGVPFSDPMADGPVIQVASERAVAKGVNLQSVLDTVSAFRQTDKLTPIILMGYMNPVERYGKTRFPANATTAGVDGLLLVDCPPEERDVLGTAMREHGLDEISLIAPTTVRERVAGICRDASGFIYYVSMKGVTGAARLDLSDLSGPIQQIREFSDLPVAVGFGVKNAEMAVEVATYADAVVMGSALVDVLSRATSESEACAIAQAFVAPVRKSLDNMPESI